MKLRTNLTHMAKQMSNSKRAKDKRNRERKVLFQEAIADGYTSRRDIAKAVIPSLSLNQYNIICLKIQQIANIF